MSHLTAARATRTAAIEIFKNLVGQPPSKAELKAIFKIAIQLSNVSPKHKAANQNKRPQS